MSESAFGVDHGEFSKAFPKIPGMGSVANAGKAVGGAAKSFAGGALKPIQSAVGQKVGQGMGAIGANKGLVAGAAGVGAVGGAGINNALNRNKRLSQYR